MSDSSSLVCAPPQGIQPIAHTQFHYCREAKQYGNTAMSNVAHALHIEGDLQRELFITAVNHTLSQTDCFTLHFSQAPEVNATSENTTSEQAQHPFHQHLLTAQQVGYYPTQIEYFDFRPHPHPAQAVEDWMHHDHQTPQHIGHHALSRHVLFQVSEQKFIWYTRAHHILVDGFGVMLFEQRCCQKYQSLLQDPSAQSHPFHPYAKWFEEEQAYRRSPRCQTDQAFWEAYLTACPTFTRLPQTYDLSQAHVLSHHLPLSERATAGLRALSKRLNIGWPDLIVSLTTRYLLRNETDEHPRSDAGGILVWLPFMNRWGSVAANIPSLVMTILPYHAIDDPSLSFEDALRKSSKELRTLYRHGRYGLEHMLVPYQLDHRSPLLLSPFINVLPFDMPNIDGCHVTHQIISRGTDEGLNFTFQGDTQAQRLMIEIDADIHSYPEAQVRQHMIGLPTFLEDILTAE